MFTGKRELLLITEDGNFPPMAMYDVERMMLTEGEIAEKEGRVVAKGEGGVAAEVKGVAAAENTECLAFSPLASLSSMHNLFSNDRTTHVSSMLR